MPLWAYLTPLCLNKWPREASLNLTGLSRATFAFGVELDFNVGQGDE